MIQDPPPADEACCGAPPGPESSPFERPGYTLCGFVDGFIDTASGSVPRVRTDLKGPDRLVTILARSGIFRNHYKIAPGLYGLGDPGAESPVLVTANYRLSFNALRTALPGFNAWILVLDTRGINVWCAAGKGTFGTDEVIRLVRLTGLDRIVAHRRLILPQLGAVGVSARDVKKACGFKVTWGPIRVEDIKEFVTSGMKADASMRRVTFTMAERLVLTPVEVTMLHKPTLWVLLAIFALSGIGTDIFSFSDSWIRGLAALLAYGGAIFAGAVLSPALLPWIPGKAFSLKGAILGIIAGIAVTGMSSAGTGPIDALGIIFFTLAVSSYLAMNFTGATPYTSPSGVEKEMRKAIPLQAAALLSAAVLWVISGF
jgi:CO dehydrogenase/acetyl-CoA synthase delta subunit